MDLSVTAFADWSWRRPTQHAGQQFNILFSWDLTFPRTAYGLLGTGDLAGWGGGRG